MYAYGSNTKRKSLRMKPRKIKCRQRLCEKLNEGEHGYASRSKVTVRMFSAQRVLPNAVDESESGRCERNLAHQFFH